MPPGRPGAKPGDPVKVAIIGLDGVDPDLLFGDLLDELDNVRSLVESGVHGPIRSSHPPASVPAWTVLATGQNPGRLGFTGIKNRKFRDTRHGKAGDYYASFLATSRFVDQPRLWDLAGKADKGIVCLNAPQTYPPEPVNGALVSGTMTHDHQEDWTYPTDLAEEIEELVGDYPHDVAEPGALQADELVEAVQAGTDKRFDVAEHLARETDWELFFLVEPGPDRVHHATWSAWDPDHPDHDPDDPRRDALVDYYRQLDDRIGRLVDTFDDDTAVVLVSEHGTMACQGVVRVNDWLRHEGYLRLHSDPDPGEGFDPGKVDWSATQAWAQGGHVARIHLNVDGREPHGTVESLEFEDVRDELRQKLERMETPDGELMGTRVLKPQEIYAGEHTDEAPDLLCYLGNLRYRAEASLGHEEIVTRTTETPHDEAVPGYNGVFVLADPQDRFSGEVDGMTLLDAGPTILELMGLPVPSEMEGRILRPDGGLHPPS